MLSSLSGNLLIVLYVSVLLGVATYGLHRYVLFFLYIKHHRNELEPASRFTTLPTVTVQLPMYNEDVVARRVIEASCQIDYPRDRFEVQVLDDSTDHSADIARETCERLAAEGYPVVYIHRTNRSGYKAGALEHGLTTARGELIAIFDADFVPPADILRNTVDFFTDQKGGYGAGAVGPPQPPRISPDPQPGDLFGRAFCDRAHSPEPLRRGSCISTGRPGYGGKTLYAMPAAGSMTRSPRIWTSPIGRS